MNNKGFTLIELLVTIAVIGVLMGAVIVAINPAKRLQDARDSNRKTIIASIASGMEACFTKYEGSFTNCDTVAKLVTNGFLKQDPTTGVTGTWTVTAGCAAVTLENPTITNGRWKYTTAAGKASEVASGCP